MTIYHYHHSTKEYIGEGQADPNPMKKEAWLIPAFATTVKPPDVEEGQVVKWNGTNWDVADIPDEIVPELIRPTREEQINLVVRPTRDAKIFALQNRIDRYNNQIAEGNPTTDSAETILLIRSIMQPLRDFPVTCIDPFNPVWPDEGI